MSNLDFAIVGGNPLSEEILRQGFKHFKTLAAHIRALPYGRPGDATDVFAVLRQQTGTCSSKHRLLAAVAHACGRTDIELIVGIYAMSEDNTPGVAAVLEATGLSSIPEAHCYLRKGTQRHDFTGLAGGGASPFAALLGEHVVSPADLPDRKARLHEDALRSWSAERSMSLSEAWAVREACIGALAARSANDSGVTQ